MFAKIKSAAIVIGSAIVGAVTAVVLWPSIGDAQHENFSPELNFAGALGAAVGASIGALITYRPHRNR